MKTIEDVLKQLENFERRLTVLENRKKEKLSYVS